MRREQPGRRLGPEHPGGRLPCDEWRTKRPSAGADVFALEGGPA